MTLSINQIIHLLMEPTASNAQLSSNIVELENFYIDCLNNGSSVQTQEE